MKVFTSESVTKGHPDKICDQIADAILMKCLEQDKSSHVACEVCCTTGTIILMGEISTKAIVNYKDTARDVLRNIGYVKEEYGISADTCSIIDMIEKQSNEINNAVTKSLEFRSLDNVDYYDTQGAGDQGIIFGYACKETGYLMPLSHVLSNKLSRRLEYVREHFKDLGIRPDGKTQVTVEYDNEGKVSRIDTILISTQHEPNIGADFRKNIKESVIIPILVKEGIDHLFKDTKVIINPSGSFIVGGPQGDTGLTGRKLAVDTYGGHAKFGGGALCGKDPSKVDRSAAYMSRWIAKHIVASGCAPSCEVQLSYAIGQASPVSINIDTKGEGLVSDYLITKMVNELFDARPLSIIEQLNLLNVNYNKYSYQCQFCNITAPWEALNSEKLCKIKEFLSNYIK